MKSHFHCFFQKEVRHIMEVPHFSLSLLYILVWISQFLHSVSGPYRVVHVRETRVTGVISHVMIGLSMLMLPYPLAYIPRPVLDGLFIYVAITALYGNQLFDRILLFFTEQVSSYMYRYKEIVLNIKFLLI